MSSSVGASIGSSEHKGKGSHHPRTDIIPPPLSHRGRKTIPHLLPIRDHTEPPIYIPGYSSVPKASDINLSTAENWLLRLSIVPKFLEYINRDFDAADLSYVAGFGGAPDLLSGLATFFGNHFDPKVQVIPDHIVTAPGASHLLQSIMFHVCNEKEAVMIQTPYWPGFDEALTLGKLKAVHVNVHFGVTGDYDPYAPDIVDQYEEVFSRSTEKITAMIICNPQNPLGGYYPEETMKKLLLFAKKHNLQVVVDELYALSVFRPIEGNMFRSVLSMDLEGWGVERGMVHVVYSFSKDLNSSGIRLGILVTQNNPELRNAVGASQQSKLSSLTSIVATGLLQDEEYLDKLLEDNPILLLKNCHIIESFLEFHDIPYIRPDAGLYLLAQLLCATGRPLTWSEEEKLNTEFTNAGVRVNRGFNFHTTDPGWFRIIFAVPVDKLVTGLKRIEMVMGKEGWEAPDAES